MAHSVEHRLDRCAKNARFYKQLLADSGKLREEGKKKIDSLLSQIEHLKEEESKHLESLRDMQKSNNRRYEANKKLTRERNDLKDTLRAVKSELVAGHELKALTLIDKALAVPNKRSREPVSV